MNKMNIWMKTTRTEKILIVLHVISWVLFIGICIKTGAIIISFYVSLFINPMGAENLFLGLNLSGLFDFDIFHYVILVLFIISLSVLKAFMVYLLIRIFLKINLAFPFSNEVASLIAKISYVAFTIGLLNLTAIYYSEYLILRAVKLPELNQYLSSKAEYLFFAGIIFVIAQVFRRGIEIQSENELTV